MPSDDWREEYKAYTSSKYELDLLENGPKSLAQSWMMGALYNKWKKIKGIKDPEPPDCSSSMKEWEQSIKKYENTKDGCNGMFVVRPCWSVMGGGLRKYA